jgi:DNA-binding MarR family transcriptional regulator
MARRQHNYSVAALEAAGAIRGEADPSDRRQTLIALTENFRETVQASRADKEDWLLQALQAQLTPQEHEQLSAAVKLLQRLAES